MSARRVVDAIDWSLVVSYHALRSGRELTGDTADR